MNARYWNALLFPLDMPAMLRRLDDLILALSSVAASTSGEEQKVAIAELQKSLDQYMQRRSDTTSAALLGWRGFPKDRRKPTSQTPTY
jgi:hypothetical protein